MLKNDTVCLCTPIKVSSRLTDIDILLCPLYGVGTLVLLWIECLDEDGNITLSVEVGQLLNTDGILVLYPSLLQQ